MTLFNTNNLTTRQIKPFETLKKGDMLLNKDGLWEVISSRKVNAGIKYKIESLKYGWKAGFIPNAQNIKASGFEFVTSSMSVTK